MNSLDRVRSPSQASWHNARPLFDADRPKTKQPKTDTGSYLTVWKKQADGSWKAVEDFVMPGAPPA